MAFLLVDAEVIVEIDYGGYLLGNVDQGVVDSVGKAVYATLAAGREAHILLAVVAMSYPLDLKHLAGGINGDDIVVVEIECKFKIAMPIYVSDLLVWAGAGLRRECHCTFVINVYSSCLLGGGIKITEVNAFYSRILAGALATGIKKGNSAKKNKCLQIFHRVFLQDKDKESG